jgi:hypothetical protein
MLQLLASLRCEAQTRNVLIRNPQLALDECCHKANFAIVLTSNNVELHVNRSLQDLQALGVVCIHNTVLKTYPPQINWFLVSLATPFNLKRKRVW